MSRSRLDHHKLLYLSSLLIDNLRLLPLDLVMKEKLLLRFCWLTNTLISHTQAIMSIRKLRIRFDRFVIEVNGLIEQTLGRSDDSKLQVSPAALGIKRHRFPQQPLCLLLFLFVGRLLQTL